jgi:SH3-like domain-containing protein
MQVKRFLVVCLLLIAVSAPILTVFAQIPIPVPQLVSPIVIVNTPALNARSGPGSQYTVIVTLPGGTELPVLASTADREWYLVATPVGNAWIDIDFVIPRGDFTFVPVIRPQDIQAQSAAPTPSAIRMPTARQAFGAAALAPRSNRRAVLEVLSVDLRPAPFEGVGRDHHAVPRSECRLCRPR